MFSTFWFMWVSITFYVHDIYTSFDCNPPKDVRGIVLDISKAFYRVWHEGLIYKMKFIGITGMPLKLLQSFLQNTPASIAKWSIFIMGTSFCWCTTGFCIRPFVLFNLHKWLNKGYLINQQIFCWWYLHFFYCKWYWCFWTWVEQWSEENIYVGLSIEDVLQSRCFKAGSRGDIL